MKPTNTEIASSLSVQYINVFQGIPLDDPYFQILSLSFLSFEMSDVPP